MNISPYQEQPHYSFPSKLEMLAQFGLEPTVDDDALPSLTYIFNSAIDEISLVVTYSEHVRFVDVTMHIRKEESFSVRTNDVVSIRIVAERGACWLQVAYEPVRKLPDMYIHIEPRLRCSW